MEPLQVLSLRVRVDLRIMVIKGNTTRTKASEQEPHQKYFSVIYIYQSLRSGRIWHKVNF